MKTIINFLVKFRSNLKRRDFLLDMFTECSRLEWPHPIKDNESIIPSIDFYIGQVVAFEGKVYGIDSVEDGKVIFTELAKESSKLLDLKSQFVLQKDHLENIPNGTAGQNTTVGRYILNYLLLADPFGNYFKYINDEIKIGKIEEQIVDALLDKKITNDQVGHYIDNIYFIGHFTELCVPSFSEKSITTSDAVSKRRAELYEKYKDQLDDPATMVRIEDELIALDKEYLKDDPSYGFYRPNGEAFDVCRKRMFLTVGMVDAFDGEAADYNFVKNSLDDGWDVNDFPVLINDLRQGVYDRAMSTAKGGEESKFVSRIFQDTDITIEDCRTSRGLQVTLTKDVIDRYLYRYIFTPKGLEMLTKDNKDKFLNKVVKVRSPQYCEAKSGYCYTCMGNLFKSLDVKNLGLIAISISSQFLTASLKSMHGVKTNLIDISDIDQFTIK